jgi:hypothetical protein
MNFWENRGMWQVTEAHKRCVEKCQRSIKFTDLVGMLGCYKKNALANLWDGWELIGCLKHITVKLRRCKVSSERIHWKTVL